MSPRFEKLSRLAARVAAVPILVLAIRVALVTSEPSALLALALALATLSYGVWRLSPVALRFATGVLLLLAVVVPLGTVNPFYASDMLAARQSGGYFVERTIAIGFGTSLLCVTLAYFVSQARVAVIRQRPPRR